MTETSLWNYLMALQLQLQIHHHHHRHPSIRLVYLLLAAHSTIEDHPPGNLRAINQRTAVQMEEDASRVSAVVSMHSCNDRIMGS